MIIMKLSKHSDRKVWAARYCMLPNWLRLSTNTYENFMLADYYYTNKSLKFQNDFLKLMKFCPICCIKRTENDE